MTATSVGEVWSRPVNYVFMNRQSPGVERQKQLLAITTESRSGLQVALSRIKDCHLCNYHTVTDESGLHNAASQCIDKDDELTQLNARPELLYIQFGLRFLSKTNHLSLYHLGHLLPIVNRFVVTNRTIVVECSQGVYRKIAQAVSRQFGMDQTITIYWCGINSNTDAKNNVPVHQATTLFIRPMPPIAKSISCTNGLSCATHRQEGELAQSRAYELMVRTVMHYLGYITEQDIQSNTVNRYHAMGILTRHFQKQAMARQLLQLQLSQSRMVSSRTERETNYKFSDVG